MLPRILCRQLNMDPTLSNDLQVSNPIAHAGILQGLFRNRYSVLLVRSESFQLWEKRPDGVPHANSNKNK